MFSAGSELEGNQTQGVWEEGEKGNKWRVAEEKDVIKKKLFCGGKNYSIFAC